MGDLGRRFLACFLRAMDDAGLPTDAAFRQAMGAYMQWAVADVLTETPDDLAGRTAMPHWSWDGLQPSE
jgi:hemoglobin